MHAATTRQTTGNSGGGTKGRGRSPQGEHDFAGIHSSDFNGRSNAMAWIRIRGWGQSSTIGELPWPHGQPPFHASVSSGSAAFWAATSVGFMTFFAKQLFTFAAQHPDPPVVTGRFTQQQRPTLRESGEQRQSAAFALAPACGPKSPMGRPRFITTYTVKTANRQQRTLPCLP